MKKRLGLMGVLLAGLLSAGTVRADDSLAYNVQFKYQVQLDSTVDRWTDVDDGHLRLRPGMTGTDFLGDASVTVVVADAGAGQCLVDFTLTTLPPAARVVSRQIVIQQGRNIDILGLKYKRHRNARVRVKISQMSGEVGCDLGGPKGARNVEEFVSNIPLHGAPSMVGDSADSYEDQLWYSDPSAHFEIYYIPNSFGDFGWNMVRDYLERELEQFQSVFDFKAMQRVNYFITPCEVPNIAWTKYRGWAIDPVTFKAYAVFNKERKDVTGIATNMNYLYRKHGYAPMLLVEGAARGFDYNHYYAKKLKWRGELPDLFKYWRTIDYRNAPDSGLQIAAGSFVNYLIGTRGLVKYFQLYSVADDFNRDSALAAVYGENRKDLVKEWHAYLDTVPVYPHLANYFYSRSKALGRNDESIELLKTLIEVDTADVDRMYDDLALLYFLKGEYDDALYALGKAQHVRARRGRRAQLVSSALFFSGKIDEARKSYAKILADTSDQGSVGSVNIMDAWLELTEGNVKRADSLLKRVDSARIVLGVDKMETEIMLGKIRQSEGKNAEADSLYESALNRVRSSLEERPTMADMYMRAGEAYVGLGQADSAFTYLNVADFLENRPYYQGRVWIAIGNAYDLLGMRDYALEYYHKVLDETTSYPARVEARKYIRTPFEIPGA